MLEEIFKITTNTRIHWVYLISAALIAAFFMRSLKIFSLHYFFNKSSKLDLQLFATNRVLKFFLILPLETALIYSLCKSFLQIQSSPAVNLDLSSTINFTLYTLALFITDDFLRFIQHYTMHKVPFLWEFHKVHHSAHVLTPLTLYRVHFLEVCISSFRRTFGTVFITCLALSLSSQVISGHQIMGALSINFIFNVLGGNLRHSHIPFSFGVLERVFISPLQHQIHHSKNPKHFDKNFGVALSIWDQLFSTWVKADSNKKIKVGLSHSQRNHSNDLFSSFTGPFKTVFKKQQSTKTIIHPQGDLI